MTRNETNEREMILRFKMRWHMGIPTTVEEWGREYKGSMGMPEVYHEELVKKEK